MTKLAVGALLTVCTTSFALAQDTSAPEGIDPAAMEHITRMGKFYQSLEGGSFTSLMKIEAPDMPFPMSQGTAVSVVKPNMFLSKSKDAMMGGIDAVSDGKELIVAMPTFKIFQEGKTPKNFADMVSVSGEVSDPENFDENDISMTLAQDPGLMIGLMLFGDSPTKNMLKDIQTLTIEGEEKIDGQDAVRIKATSGDSLLNPAANATLWIAKGEQPWLLGVKPDLEAMIGDDMDGDAMAMSLKITLLFEDWSTKKPAADTFTMSLGEDWEPVDNLMAAVMEKAAEQMGGLDMDMMDDFDMGEEDIPGAFEAPKHATVGTEAPAFSLKTLRTGKEVSLADLKGKVVVLDFWATWCSPCVAGLPTVDKVTTAFKDQGVVFYAVDLREPADRVQKFVDKKKWTFPVLLDGDGAVAKEYGVSGIPHSVVIGADGKIRNVHIGFAGAPALEQQLTEEIEAALAEATTEG